MSIIPEFLIKRIYKKGSLRPTDDGIAFDLKNVLGPGVISGLNFVKINDMVFESNLVKFITQGIETIASVISEENPIAFRLGQEGTLKLLTDGKILQDGLNQITIELSNPEAGIVRVDLCDHYQAA